MSLFSLTFNMELSRWQLIFKHVNNRAMDTKPRREVDWWINAIFPSCVMLCVCVCVGLDECAQYMPSPCELCDSSQPCRRHDFITPPCHRDAICDFVGSDLKCRCLDGFTGTGHDCDGTLILIPTTQLDCIVRSELSHILTYHCYY